MKREEFSQEMNLRNIQITDSFWKQEMELVRQEVIPYQWETLNDRVEGAAPSYCMRNFKIAGKMLTEQHEKGTSYEPPKYTFRGFEALPDDPKHLEDKFYGFVFQDSDFAKWIEAVGYSLTQHPDPKLEEIADGAIDIVCAAQQDNGYLDTYYIINGMDQIFSNLRDHHELYCFGHLAEGAIAYYEATGKDKLLKAVERYADFIDSYFGPEPEKCKGYPGHEIAEMALFKLYETTGNEKYLKLGEFFINERGRRPYYWDKEHPPIGKAEDIRYHYHQAHVPVREQSEAFGHAVRAVYLYAGMAEMAKLAQDDELYAACERLWKNITEQKMYITGGIGSTNLGEAFTYNYDLPNDMAYAETCASIGLVFFARRMLEIKADSKYADIMELCLHNGILSGMALDGKSFFYVNPLKVVPEACEKDERKFHVKPVRQKWFGCACCPPNLARLISSLGLYAYTESEDTLWIHLYMGGTITKQLGRLTNAAQTSASDNAAREVRVELASNFPWNGDASATVHLAEDQTPVHMTLAFRIPGWCTNWQPPVLPGKETRIQDGYFYVTGDYADGDTMELHFPMEVRMMESDMRVTEDIGKAAIMRGPIVYCLEEQDNGAHLDEICLDPNASYTEIQTDICGTKIIALEGPAWRRKEPMQNPTDGAPAQTTRPAVSALYHTYTKATYEPVTIRLIPYYTWANRGKNEMQVYSNIRE